jgi:hypothetical protein
MHIIKVYAKREAEPKKFVRKEKKSASVWCKFASDEHEYEMVIEQEF